MLLCRSGLACMSGLGAVVKARGLYHGTQRALEQCSSSQSFYTPSMCPYIWIGRDMHVHTYIRLCKSVYTYMHMCTYIFIDTAYY